MTNFATEYILWYKEHDTTGLDALFFSWLHWKEIQGNPSVRVKDIQDINCALCAKHINYHELCPIVRINIECSAPNSAWRNVWSLLYDRENDKPIDIEALYIAVLSMVNLLELCATTFYYLDGSPRDIGDL